MKRKALFPGCETCSATSAFLRLLLTLYAVAMWLRLILFCVACGCWSFLSSCFAKWSCGGSKSCELWRADWMRGSRVRGCAWDVRGEMWVDVSGKPFRNTIPNLFPFSSPMLAAKKEIYKRHHPRWQTQSHSVSRIEDLWAVFFELISSLHQV